MVNENRYFIKLKLNDWDYIRLIVRFDSWRNEIDFVKYSSWMVKDKMWWVVITFEDFYNFEEMLWRMEVM